MNTYQESDIIKLIHKGGVFFNVSGNSLDEVYFKISKRIVLPEYLTSEEVYKGLCTRESLLSTAIGYGIAIPHSANCLIKKESDQEVCIVYLKNPIKIATPDHKPVTTLFIVLSMNSSFHIQIIGELSELFGNIHFRNALKHQSDEAVLSAVIRELIN